MNHFDLLIAYKFDDWHSFKRKTPVSMTISRKKAGHCLIVGSSGSGKSYETLLLLARFYNADKSLRTYLCDFKGEDSFAFLKPCSYYFSYTEVFDAIYDVYNIMHRRQSGEDKSRNPILLIIDEYVVMILYLACRDKKKADSIKNMIAELLMLGRSMNIKVWIGCQRPDASVFNSGARLNFHAVLVLGNGGESNSLYEMVIPKEHIPKVLKQNFKTGEGVVVFDNKDLQFIKVPKVIDINAVNEECIKALS